MHLGNFSVSLSVKDLQKSLKFYQTLCFEQVSGDIAENWLVLQNGSARIGLFQDIIDENLLTFNPKWNENKQTTADMEDVREIAQKMTTAGFSPEESSLDGEGPAYFYLKDPDGNKLLFDQYV